MKHEEFYLEGLHPPIVFATLPKVSLPRAPGETPELRDWDRHRCVLPPVSQVLPRPARVFLPVELLAGFRQGQQFAARSVRMRSRLVHRSTGWVSKAA